MKKDNIVETEEANKNKKTPIIVSVSLSDILNIETEICIKHNRQVTKGSVVGCVNIVDSAQSDMMKEWSAVVLPKPDNRHVPYTLFIDSFYRNRYIEYIYRKNTVKRLDGITISGIEDKIGVARVHDDGSVNLIDLRDQDVIRENDGSIKLIFRILWLPFGNFFNEDLKIQVH